MSSRILVNPQTPLGKQLCESVDMLRKALDGITRVQKAADAMAYGEVAPYSSMASELGITATTAGNTAADFYALLQAVQGSGALGAPIIGEFISKLDQG